MSQAALHDEPAVSAAGSVDPVCRMTVDPAKAAGRAEHGGRTYLFCSGHCLSHGLLLIDTLRGVGAGVTVRGARRPPMPLHRPRVRSARPR